MAEIFVKQWNYQKRLQVTMDVVMGRASLHQIATLYKTTLPTIKEIIQDITPLDDLNLTNKVVIYKDVESIYLDHNDKAGRLGPEKNNGNLYKNTDKDVAPDFATRYTIYDQDTLLNKKSGIYSDKVIHKDFGVVDAVANIHPIFNDHKDCRGVLVVGDIKVFLARLPFPIILKHLRSGHAHYFIKQARYELLINHNLIRFYRREIECMLYLLIGLSSKEIARHMLLSHRTVEGIISRIKDKMGLYNKSDIVDYLLISHFLDLLR